MAKREKDHDTCEDVEKNTRDMVAYWIEFPEIIIDCVTQYSNRLKIRGFLEGKYLSNIVPF